ncbi:MAG: A/G-specific adenine glycosylase [Gammaproteobacteria bacterium]
MRAPPGATPVTPATAPALFRRRVLRWFDRHGRKSLPWQRTRDPYAIWVAEIMLQQTRVGTVIPYYRKFIAQIPDIAALARCAPDMLLHYWSGLGYYARARNLQAAAKQIMARHGGVFPAQFAHVVALPGIGRSTAGAILTFAHGRRHAVLDANVKRVLARHHAIGGNLTSRDAEAQLWQLAECLLPRARPGDYNQALMDIGASVCAARPNCAECPLMRSCEARRRGEQHAYPQRKPKPARPRKRTTMLLIQNPRAELLLLKRPPAGIWGGLWSLPEYAPMRARDALKPECIRQWCAQEFGLSIRPGRPLPELRHSFTHFDLDIRPFPATVTDAAARSVDAGAQIWYNRAKPARIGLPAAVGRILEMIDDA